LIIDVEIVIAARQQILQFGLRHGVFCVEI